MYDKSYYRAVLNDLKPIVKLSYYCKKLDIHNGNLSKFMKDEHHEDCMSLSSLEQLYNEITINLGHLLKQ